MSNQMKMTARISMESEISSKDFIEESFMDAEILHIHFHQDPLNV